jgi:hypothetical protein
MSLSRTLWRPELRQAFCRRAIPYDSPSMWQRTRYDDAHTQASLAIFNRSDIAYDDDDAVGRN